MEPILEVRNLSVGFRTAGGVVQAVRDISFVLPRGRTLAVVGESGSGKSVTCRAILGILAGNAVVQSGEILFDGQDLLKLSEDDFYPIRGDKIAMIFQDPMSSLNPIMRVGKQLTEAMLLKNKSARRGARAAFRGKLHLLNDALVQALRGKQTAAQIGKTVRAYARSFRADTLPQDGEAVPHRQAFADWARAGVQLSHDTATERKRALLPLLHEYAAKISADMQETELRALCRRLRELARAAIDELSVQKNSAEYTFGTSLSAAVKRFTDGKKNNPKAQARYDRKMQAYRKAESHGRTPAALPAPPAICDLSRAAQAIGQVLLRLAAVYEEKLGDADSFDAQAQALRLFDYLRGQAAVAAASISERLARERAVRLLQEVGLPSPESMMQKYPFELSGGMRQRVVIAIALAADPDILICDEPTTALDVTIQAQILELINRIKAERNLTVLFITHDLGVVANMADEIAVMYAGKIVEYGSAEEVFYDPRHPYTWALLSSMPDLDTKEKLAAIPGTPPNMLYPPKGDAFAARNQYALAIDFERQPPMFAVTPTHRAATWLLHPDAPALQPPKTVLRRIERMRTRTAGESTAAQRQGKETRAKTSAARRRKSCDKQDILLQVEGLTTVFGTGKKQNRAVDGVSFSVRCGEVFGLVGESGSGKTTTGRTIIGLYPAAAGNVFLDGRLLCAGGRKPRRADRHFTSDNIQMIFQDPIASLNPRMTVREIIAEGLVIRGMKDKKEIDRRVYEALDMVGLLPEHAGRYPHEFSGGQRQRIGIARALILRPKLIIADEPVSALDVSIQAQVISLMNELRQTFGLTILFIAHDLSVVKYFCDRIAVMYRGKIVELAGDDELFHRPMHPYTQSLLSAIPLPDPRYEKTRKRIVYTPVPAPEGEAMPQLREVLPQHFVSCTETEFAALQAAAKTAPKGGSL